MIIGRVGAYCGSVYFYKDKCWVTDNALIGKVKVQNDGLFLFYLLKNLCLNNYRAWSSQPLLNQSILNSIPIRLPQNKQTQRRIADILSALDEKIELNRQTNATLEAIAQAIFKEWFVDFNFPGATGEMVDSELGMIPIGWKVGYLEDILVLQRGFDLPANNRTPGKYPVIASSGPSGTHHEFMVKCPGVTTGRSGVLGNVFYIHEDFWPLNTSLWVKEFKNSTPIYAFHLLQGLDLSAFNAGSAVPTLNRNHVHNLPSLLPPMEIIRSFDEVMSPIMEQQKVNVEESRTLTALRDALLPKWMNGEIPVGANNYSPLRTVQSPRKKGTSKTIGSIVRGFKIGVTKWFQENHSPQTVWQRNYYEHIIRDDDDLNRIREYIINNPMNWDTDENNPAVKQ
ncbi:MAG: restriction endonuclease subunit S [Chloroflexota bacterium]